MVQGFYCGSRKEFDDLCQRLSRITVGDSRSLPLIEVHRMRPAHFPSAQPYVPTLAAACGMAGKYYKHLLIALYAIIHTRPFNGPLSGTTHVSHYQKGKTNLDFTEARDSEWQWHQLGHM